jgi:hypothetical protein
MFKPILLAVVASMLVDVCGYHPAGKGKSLPPYVKTLAIPIFKNHSLRYRVEQRFTQAIMDEVLRRARKLKVTTNPDDADAVLTGDILRFSASGTILDDQGRTRAYHLSIGVSVILRDLKTRRILYDNPNIIFGGEYQISGDPTSFFNEENSAVDRIAKDFAQSIVSTILEGL